ncbi:MAG: MFS transporter [Actinomycetota bacterium]
MFGRWRALVVLGAAQFLMVLDQAVMNVSITQLTEDFDTTVTTIQGIITFYALVMAATMMIGAKLTDIIGRRRAFRIGLVIYGAGSALTAASWNIGTLLVGWSVLEGLGAALVLPSLVTLIASNHSGRDRGIAFGVIGGVAGVGIAAGPIIGGYFTANLSWRWVFVGEVILAVLIVLGSRWIGDATSEGRRPDFDAVGALLSASGVGLVVIGLLQAGTWGFVEPKNSPIEPLGFSLTPFVVLAGGVVLWCFAWWETRRESRGVDPLVRLGLLSNAPLRAGLSSFLTQNVILLGVFFILPLYLQIVLGLDALDTGIRMLPISIAMFLTSSIGPALSARFGVRRIVQAGFVIDAVAAFFLIGTVGPDLDGVSFAVALTVLGVGMGLIASQLGNVVTSSVSAADRGEAGGLQYTFQQLGSSIGTALIGAVVVSALVTAFVGNIGSDERITERLTEDIEVSVAAGASFVSSASVEEALAAAEIDSAQVDAVVEQYEEAQLDALRRGLLLAAFLAVISLAVTRHLPTRIRTDDDENVGDGVDEPVVPGDGHPTFS